MDNCEHYGVIAHEFVNRVPTKYRCVYCQAILFADQVAEQKLRVLERDHIRDGEPWTPWRPKSLSVRLRYSGRARTR